VDGGDGGDGKEPAFLTGLEAAGSSPMCIAINAIDLQDPNPQVPQWSQRGRRSKHPKVQVASTRGEGWTRRCLRGGEKGQLVAEYLQARVWIWDTAQPRARGWHLLVRRDVGATEISHDCLSNAPEQTPLRELARVQAQRFFIEHSVCEAKSACGLADDQVRRWDAWHHHMALVMVATLFLLKHKIQGRAQWPMLSVNDLVTALEHRLPRRQLTAEELA
jgi:SRSO17 transposase